MVRSRPAIAAGLMLLAIVAVFVVIDQNVAKESNVNTEVLSRPEKQTAEEIGRSVEEEDNKKVRNKGWNWKKHEAAASAALEKDMSEIARDRYGSNCLTLKAYAIAQSDQMDNPSRRALNELRSVLEGMRSDPDKDNTKAACAAKLTKLMAHLQKDPDLQGKDSIGEQMLKVIDDQMRNHRGILVWGRLLDRSAGCDDSTDQRDCMFKIIAKGDAQFVYLDAGRVGFDGQPGIFSRMAVTSGKLMQTVKGMLASKDIKENNAPTEFKFTRHDAQFIIKWSGK